MVRRAPLARAHRRRPLAAVSVLSRVAARGSGRDARQTSSDWLVEWKWDGIRAQLVKRGGVLHLWSRGEELITHRFPEIIAAASRLPDGTVLDGEVLAFRDDRPLPFSALQQRIGRQKQVAQLVRAVPVVFMTYDILEDRGEDIRELPQVERRGQARGPADRHRRPPALACRPGLVLGRARHPAQRIARARRRGADAQAADVRVRRRTQTRRLVEVEDRAVHDRRRAHLRAAGQRPPGQPSDRLHIRRLGPGRARADCEGVLRALERRDCGNGPLDQAPHAGALRPGSSRRAGAGVRARVRSHRPLDAASFRHRGPLSADASLANRQESRKKPIRSRPCRSCSSSDGPGLLLSFLSGGR